MKLNHNQLLRALTRLDEEDLKDHLESCVVTIPEDKKAFWIGIHKVRATMEEMPEAYRLESERWLQTVGAPLEHYEFAAMITFNKKLV